MAVLRNPQRLAVDVSNALPQHYGPDYNTDTFVQWDVGEKVVAAAQRGVEAAAQEAYRAGYRAGQRHGQWTAARDVRDLLDAKSQSRLWEPQHRWRRDTAEHAQQWVVDANQDLVRASVHHIPSASLVPLLRKELPDWSEVPQWAGNRLPEIAAFAYDLGRRSSQQQAYTFTDSSIDQYAYHRAAELGVSPDFVDADLGLTPGQRPAGFTEPAADKPTWQAASHPTALARSSFAAPATITPTRPPAANATRPSVSPRRNEHASGRSR